MQYSLCSEALKRETLTQSPFSSIFVLLALATLLQVVEAQGESVCGCTCVRTCVTLCLNLSMCVGYYCTGTTE